MAGPFHATANTAPFDPTNSRTKVPEGHWISCTVKLACSVTLIDPWSCATSDCTEVSGSPSAAAAMHGLKAAMSNPPANTQFLTLLVDGAVGMPLSFAVFGTGLRQLVHTADVRVHTLHVAFRRHAVAATIGFCRPPLVLERRLGAILHLEREHPSRILPR